MNDITPPGLPGKPLPATLGLILASNGKILIEKGWPAIPVYFRDKSPVGNDWQNLPINPDRFASVTRNGPVNIGCLTGAVIGVDLDVSGHSDKFDTIVNALQAMLGVSPLVRWGHKGCLWPYRCSDPSMPKQTLKLGELGKIEILAKGQQFVMVGVHPAGNEYLWGGYWGLDEGVGPDPLSISVAELPCVTPDMVRAALANVAKLIGVPFERDAKHKPSAAKGEPVTLPHVATLLSFIDPDCSRDDWRNAIAAVRACNCPEDEDGSKRLDVVDEWSSNGDKYEGWEDVETVWETMPPTEKGVGYGTLLHLARLGGYDGPPARKSLTETFAPYVAAARAKRETVSNPKPPEGRLIMLRASDLTPKKLEWLWPSRFPRACLNLLAGHGDMGKTTVLLDIAARLTRGSMWPDGSGEAPRGTVIYFSAEDLTEETLLPRFMAAGGDREKLVFIRAVTRGDGNGVRTFNLQEDLRELERGVRSLGDVVAIIFDPVSSYFGTTDTWRATQVRTVLEPVAEFAGRCGVTILGNTHFTKGSQGRVSAVMRILDSGAMGHIARGCYVVVEDAEDEDRRLFLPAKGNLTKKVGGLSFTIDSKAVAPEIVGSFVKWEAGAVTDTADEALAAMDDKGKPKGAQASAIGFLEAQLGDGPRLVDEVEAAAQAQGIALRTLRRAKQALGVVSNPPSSMGGKWLMRLPNGPAGAEGI